MDPRSAAPVRAQRARCVIIEVVPSVEALGVHRVAAPEPCHLVEVLIRDSTGPVDLARFTQQASALPQSEWQVPYDEHLVLEGGVVSLWRAAPSEAWIGDVRLAFFFHHLELDQGLLTPWGEVALPRESPRPEHLQAMSYEAP